MATDDVIFRLSQALKQIPRNTAWSNIMSVRLGDGNEPSTVIVPSEKATDFGMFYAYRIVDGTKEVMQVANLYAGLAYDDSMADTPVVVGYPPKSNKLCIMSIDPAGGTAFTGGALPSQIADTNSYYVSPERFSDFKLQVISGLILGHTGGSVRRGNTKKTVFPDDSFLDLTDYVPTTVDMAVFLLIGLDSDDTVVVVEGEQFDVAEAEPVNFMPDTLESDHLFLGTVYLVYGDTAITQERVMNMPDIYYAPSPLSLPATSATLYDETTPPSVTGLTTGHFWLDGDGGLHVYYNDVWTDFSLGSPTYPASVTYAKQYAIKNTDTAKTIAGGAITITSTDYFIVVAAETGTSDDLDTISGVTHGTTIAIKADTGDTITLTHAIGNLYSNNATGLVITGDKIAFLMYAWSKWYIMSS